MMKSQMIAVIIFVLIACKITNGVARIFGDQACQAITPEGHLRPDVPHKTLTEEFLNSFNEIIVIGDQHGCFDEEQLLIKRHQLNDTVLKIFTGDFTSKGNKNLEVLRFIRSCTSCISVRGNNDEKTLLKVWMKQHKKDYEYNKEDKWIANLTESDVAFLRNLPYSFYLPSLNARVCHGGFLPGGIPIEENRPYTIMNIRTVIADPKCPGGWRPTREEFLDSVKAPTFPWASQWRGPEHIYFGHDHKRQLQLYPYATGVDTACVRGHYMTGVFIKGPRSGTFATQPALKRYYHGKV